MTRIRRITGEDSEGSVEFQVSSSRSDKKTLSHRILFLCRPVALGDTEVYFLEQVIPVSVDQFSFSNGERP